MLKFKDLSLKTIDLLLKNTHQILRNNDRILKNKVLNIEDKGQISKIKCWWLKIRYPKRVG